MITGANLLAAVATGVLAALVVSGPATAKRRLEDSPAQQIDPGRPRLSWRLRLGAGAAAGIAAAALVGQGLWSALIGVVVAGIVAGALGRVEPSEVARTDQAVALSLPGALDMLAGALGSGMPLAKALSVVIGLTGGPLAGRLARVEARLAVGAGESSAWRSLAEDKRLGRLARDAARSAESGAPLADLLTVHATRARLQRNNALRARARAIGVRSVLPVTICFLPAFVAIGIVPIVVGAFTALVPAGFLP